MQKRERKRLSSGAAEQSARRTHEDLKRSHLAHRFGLFRPPAGIAPCAGAQHQQCSRKPEQHRNIVFRKIFQRITGNGYPPDDQRYRGKAVGQPYRAVARGKAVDKRIAQHHEHQINGCENAVEAEREDRRIKIGAKLHRAEGGNGEDRKGHCHPAEQIEQDHAGGSSGQQEGNRRRQQKVHRQRRPDQSNPRHAAGRVKLTAGQRQRVIDIHRTAVVQVRKKIHRHDERNHQHQCSEEKGGESVVDLRGTGEGPAYEIGEIRAILILQNGQQVLHRQEEKAEGSVKQG